MVTEYVGTAVIIKTARVGKSTMWHFQLKAPNGQILAHSETYTAKYNVTEVLRDYFPNFEVIDNT